MENDLLVTRYPSSEFDQGEQGSAGSNQGELRGRQVSHGGLSLDLNQLSLSQAPTSTCSPRTQAHNIGVRQGGSLSDRRDYPDSLVCSQTTPSPREKEELTRTLIEAGWGTFLDSPPQSFDEQELEEYLGTSPVWRQVSAANDYLEKRHEDAKSFYRLYIDQGQLWRVRFAAMIAEEMEVARGFQMQALRVLAERSKSQSADGEESPSSVLIQAPYEHVAQALYRHQTLGIGWVKTGPLPSAIESFYQPICDAFEGIRKAPDSHWIHEGGIEKAVVRTFYLYLLLREVLSHRIMDLIDPPSQEGALEESVDERFCRRLRQSDDPSMYMVHSAGDRSPYRPPLAVSLRGGYQ